MKKWNLNFIVIILLAVNIFSDNIFKQYKVKLSNKDGVPYSMCMGIYCLWGFDVDNNKFYFFGGSPSTIVIADTTGQIIQRKILKEIKPSPINVYNDSLYLFDKNKNNLYVYNKNSLELLGKKKIFIDKPINNYKFVENDIIFELIFTQHTDDIKNTLQYFICHIRSGFNNIEKIDNEHNLPSFFNEIDYNYYLGKYNNKYLLLDSKNNNNIVLLLDTLGKNIKKFSFSDELIGTSFFEEPEEHWKRKYNNIYILMREDKKVLITKIKIDDIFNDRNPEDDSDYR